MKKIMICLMALCVLYSCGEKKKSGVKAPTRVTTLLASPAFVDGGQTYVGIVEESEGTSVSFTGMGAVKRMLVNEGQHVNAGQLIAEIDDTQARSALKHAQAQMVQANDALYRYKQLHDAGSLPEMQWVEVQSKVAQAQSQLDMAKKNLADCRLIAPVSGIIGKKLINAGETAMPSQAVVTILNINTLKVKVAIPEAEMNSINPNTQSTITVDAVGEELKGGRIEKGVQADALTHTYDIRINVANPKQKLLPGMVTTVKFINEGSQAISGISVPVTAVQRGTDKSYFVWIVDSNNTAHRNKVSVGSTSGNYISITEGIKVGQRIVTEGYQKLSEGTKVVF